MTDQNEITLRKSSRDLGWLRAGLEAWLAARLPDGAAPEVAELTAPRTGHSSETVLFTAT
jgi:hypothetical protein